MDGSLTVAELLTDHLVREMHNELYEGIWRWAGLLRQRELSIGVPPERVAVELRSSLESIAHRWAHTHDWSAHELGIAVHAEVVRIHPFVDGNGRTTRMLANLVFVAAQDQDRLDVYDWTPDRDAYIGVLRRYDGHRDPSELSRLIESLPLGE